MIKFENIEIRFGDFVAIPNLSLDIHEGEFFTLLGPSGCGKTTALRALAGLNEPSKGKIYINGKDVTKAPSHKRQLGMVFQNYALFPTMSVYENIAFGLKMLKLSTDEIDQRVRDIAREVEITPTQLERNVSALSGGQQQRVAIARSLVTRPQILLLDEPLSNLDAKLRHQLRSQLKDMQRHFGITSVYVTHDQGEALTMSDRIAVLNAGHIEQVGTPEEIYSRSSTEFVCNFIGDANLLPDEALTGWSGHHEGQRHYVRIERVELSAANSDPVAPHHLALAGTVRERRYEGTTSTYLVALDQHPQAQPLRVIVREDGTNRFAEGDHVRCLIHADNVLHYQPAQGKDAEVIQALRAELATA